MGLSDKKYSYDKLGEINTNGIEVAQFPQIRDAIADRMREIYGDDIDLSTASADGQYINMEALILNNVYRLLSNLYDNVNPFTATGKYLDILCSLTNVKRKSSTRSTAQVYVKNVSSSTISPDQITAIDKNNIEWVWKNPKDLSGVNNLVSFNADEIMTLEFICSQYGAVEAYANPAIISNVETDIDWDSPNFMNLNGDIYKTVDYGTFKIYQASNAIPGNEEETDASLRNRQYQYLGSNSTTTQSGLEAALYNRDDIVDVYVLNNVSGVEKTAVDSNKVANHNIYIALRYKDGVTPSVDEIAKTIYQKLTPGVNTQRYDLVYAKGGDNVTKSITLFSGIITYINWKKCIPVNPTITATFITNSYYKRGVLDGATWVYSDFEIAIKNQVNKYLSGIKINEPLVSASILSVISGADLKPQGYKSFDVNTCSIDDDGTDVSIYTAPLTYYEYNNYAFSYSTVGNVTTGTLVISYVS